MARAFHRVPPQVNSSSTPSTASSIRRLSTSSSNQKWEGSKPKDHITNENDKHNVHYDANNEGKTERSKGEGSRGTSEKAGDANKKAKEEFPEAPDTIGMQDERGQRH